MSDRFATPRVDVLMTAFNAARTIGAAVASIRAQTLRDFRLVVVDDGSTDDTRAIVEAATRDDERVSLIAKPHGGIVESLDAGLAHCRAPLLARFDADDLSDPERLAHQVDYLERHPTCVAVASSAIHVDEDGRPLGTRARYAPIDEADPDWFPCREPYLLQPFLMLRRDAFDAVGGYRRLQVAEDSDLYWRLADRGRLVNLDETLGAYRLGTQSVSSRSIVHGRRLAFWSQLVGLSARRRRSGHEDLVFDDARLSACADATTLDDHCRVGTAGVEPDEMPRLRLAMSMKLLELARYRPFEIDAGDCRFIRRAVADGIAAARPENRITIREDLMHATARLLRAGHGTDAWRLCGPRAPALVARLAVRRIRTAARRA